MKFFYSPNFYFGLRKAMGVFIPIAFFFIIFKNYDYGYAFISGALGLTVIDQPWGATRRTRATELFVGLIFITVSVTITNMVAPFHSVSWLFVGAMVFSLSMLSAYGRIGAQIGFSALLVSLLALSHPHTFNQSLLYSVLTFGGCLFYFLFSTLIAFIFRHQQNRQVIATALYDTAKYIKARAKLYDISHNLDESYREIIGYMSRMLESQQISRDVVLRTLPNENKKNYAIYVRNWNIFIAMVSLLDSMASTQTDYEYLRKKLGAHDILLFMRDTLIKLATTLDQASTHLLMHRPLLYRNSVKAELRAIEFEIETLKNQGILEKDAELYGLLIQIQRRLRNATFNVEQITQNLVQTNDPKPNNQIKRDSFLLKFRSKNDYSLGVLKRQLTFSSATFRYSLRITLAIFVVQFLNALFFYFSTDTQHESTLMTHTGWILITVLLIMRPGFALTQQRTSLRLVGTFFGCLLTIGLFMLTHSDLIYLLVMLIAMILGNSLIQNNFRIGTIFITIYVLIGFHFLSPLFLWVIGERFIDTLIACMITFVFSFIFPRWEKDQIPRITLNTLKILQSYLIAAVNYTQSLQEHPTNKLYVSADDPFYAALQLARKNMHIAYSAFADSFARMMNEPKRHQLDVVRIYNVLLQSDALASQISSIATLMAQHSTISSDMQSSLNYIGKMLTLNDQNTHLEAPPVDLSPEYISMRFPIKQMYKAVQIIHQESLMLGFQNTRV